MEGQLFHIGQEVTPILEVTRIVEQLKFGEIYTIGQYRKFELIFKHEWYVMLNEVKTASNGDELWFNQRAFAPVAPSEAIEELVEEALLIHGVI